MFRIAAFLLLIPVMVAAQPTKEIQYLHTDEVILNPERGFFRQISHSPGSSVLTVEEVRQAREDGFTVIKRNYTFSDFREKDLDEARLNVIRTDFQALRDGGAKVVVRFRYSTRIGDPDASLEIIRRHMKQLKPILHEYEDVIAVVSAGLIGAWGEWHASTNNLETPENMRHVLDALLDAVPVSRQVQVRTARYKMSMFGPEPLTRAEAFNGSAKARTAHHNDGFLGSANDIGTYYNTQVEKSYQETESSWLAIGGETGGFRGGNPYYKCYNAMMEMQRMKWSFINIGWYGPTVQSWKDDGCFDDIDRQIGYRYALLEGVFPESVKAGASIPFSITFRNHGWASNYNERPVFLVLKNEADGRTHPIRLSADPRYWLPGETLWIKESPVMPASITPGSYSIHLWLPDAAEPLRSRSDYSIRLANQDVWDEATGLNRLHHTIRIE
jgi:hypothetical protein